mgnify:CR=1 FL=1
MLIYLLDQEVLVKQPVLKFLQRLLTVLILLTEIHATSAKIVVLLTMELQLM